MDVLRNVEPAPVHLIAAPADGLYAWILFGVCGLASMVWAIFMLFRKKDWVPLLLCAGSALAVINEPMCDILTKLFYASNHMGTIDTFGRDIPLVLAPGYMAWCAVVPYYVARYIQRGATKKMLYLIALFSFLSVVIVDIIGTSSGNWVYYGTGPLHGFGGSLPMAPFPVIAGFLLYRAYARGAIGVKLTAFFLPTVALAASWATTCLPLYFALNTELPLMVDLIFRVMTPVLCIGVVWFIAEEVGTPSLGGQNDG